MLVGPLGARHAVGGQDVDGQQHGDRVDDDRDAHAQPDGRDAQEGVEGRQAVAQERDLAHAQAAVDELESDDEVWVGILQANTEGQQRPVFCAGADLKAVNAGDGASLSTERGGFGGLGALESRGGVNRGSGGIVEIEIGDRFGQFARFGQDVMLVVLGKRCEVDGLSREIVESVVA